MKSYDLTRFKDAQSQVYTIAVTELRRGKKESHRMQYIFPQIEGVDYSEMAKRYAIKDIEEAKAFLKDETLGARLSEMANILLSFSTHDPKQIFGDVDSRKLHSSMTLFLKADPSNEVFKKVIYKFFYGNLDPNTLRILNIDDED